MAPRRPGARGPSRSSGPQSVERGVVDDQHQREGGEQLEQFGRAIDAPQQHDLDQRADARRRRRRGRDDAAPEAERAADLGGEGVGDVGPQHIEGPVRDIDDAGDAEDQRQAGGDKEQAGGGREPVERLEQEGVESHRSLAASAVTLSPCGRGCPSGGEAERGRVRAWSTVSADPSPGSRSLSLRARHPLPQREREASPRQL